MIIQITDQELQNFKGSLQLYYTSAINDYLEDLRPFVEEHLQKKFKKEVEDAQAKLRSKLQKSPVFIAI